jgi:predicted ATPase/DNA-binding CsgD family transcriptional regulator
MVGIRMHRVSRAEAGNLPQELTSFVGRRGEIVEVRRLLSEARLVTLVGPGGVGKTRLALRVASGLRKFRDGAWLVELDRLHDPQLLISAVSGALGLRDQAGRSPMQMLADRLTDRRMLLVLDNCEHLLCDVAKMAEELMRTTAQFRILATSRQPLGIADEAILAVPPLVVPEPARGTASAEVSRNEAATLFIARAGSVRPRFAITESNQEAVVEICRRLDGLPLAIELAAARLRALSPDQIRDRLGEQLGLLTHGPRVVAPRQQTLRSCIAWSYELCTRPEQRAWARLSVLAGDFTVDVAEGLCADGRLAAEDLASLIGSLVDKSILIHDGPTGPGPTGAEQYRMLDSIRAYGRDRLREAGEEAPLRRRHRDYFQNRVLQIEADWFGPHQADRLTWVHQELPDIRAALDFSLSEPDEAAAVRTAGALWPCWIAGGRLSEGRSWLDKALAANDSAGPERAKALWVNALIAGLLGDTGPARTLLAECHQLLDHADDATQAPAARVSGLVAMLGGEHDQAVSWFERSIRHLSAAQRPDSQSVLSYADLGVIRGLSGDVEGGIALSERGRALCEEHGETWALSWVLPVLTFLRLVRDEEADVASDLHRILRIKDGFGDILGVLQASEMLAWVAAAHGDATRAARLLGATEALWKPLGAFLLGFRPYLDRHTVCRSRARAALGAEAFGHHLRSGARLDLPQLVDYALEQPPRTPPPSGSAPPPLTGREHEVARLIAEGLTNDQISHRLVLSRRTVEGHVYRIMTKLGYTSRAQIAAMVVSTEHDGHRTRR